MRIDDIIPIIENKYPLHLQESFDCSGLLVNSNHDIQNILICLDITCEVVKYAIDNKIGLIISHHPLIFMNYYNSFEINRLMYHELRNANIAVYSMHTNYDNYEFGMNYQYVKNISFTESIFYNNLMCCFTCEKSINSIISKEVEHCVKIYSKHDRINRVAVLLGSGGFMIEKAHELGCDTFISSEFKHHEILYAIHNNIMLIDVTHQMEHIFCNDIMLQLIAMLNNKINVETYENLYRIEGLK